MVRMYTGSWRQEETIPPDRFLPPSDQIQIPHRHPPCFLYLLLSKLPNEGPPDAPVVQEPTTGTNNHTLLTPREHNVCPSAVLHEPRGRGPDDRDDDMVFFVTLEGVDVEYRVFPGETRVF